MSGSGAPKSGNFPSFRFSPGDEEIEEIALEDPSADVDEKSQSLPESPKAPSGDASPLKEIFKHKWSNKWDKRSLSLDLDLKGKIINAIEDKKKSIKSHFISEEGEVLPPASNAIAEHVGQSVDSMEGDLADEKSYPGGEELQNIEEVGTDSMEQLGLEEQQISSALKFTIPSEMLEDYNHGTSVCVPLLPPPKLPNVHVVMREDVRTVNVTAKMWSAICSHDYMSYLTALFAVALASQSWMTEVEANYDPLTCHIRTTKIIFVRLRGSYLYISYPHPKHRIYKRRLWNDPPLTGELTFTKHCVYPMSGAKVYIAPDKLSKRRIWSKKYPIAVSLEEHSTATVITSADIPDPDKTSTSEAEAVPNGSSVCFIGGERVSLEESAIVSKEDCLDRVLYLFTRTDREKDCWFRDLVIAARAQETSLLLSQRQDYVLPRYMTYMAAIIPAIQAGVHAQQDSLSTASGNDGKKSNGDEKNNGGSRKEDNDSIDQDYENSRKSSPSLEESMGLMENIVTIPQSPDFLNAFIWRIFFDFYHNNIGTIHLTELIQKKLNVIRKPQFLDTLTIRDLDLGTTLPIIHKASAPKIDDRGLWIDLDIAFDGVIAATLETKLNLMKLRKSPSQDQDDNSSNNHDDHGRSSSPVKITYMYDEDAYDSGESSDDELGPDEIIYHHKDESGARDEIVPINESSLVGSKGKKILRMAEKIVSSNFVQQASEMKVVKKAIANVSNTPLMLSVELKSIVGTLVINVPPPPTDRIWIGFRYNPAMQISAKPKFGSRTLSLTHVIDWIEKKILHEFQRVMVFPNMNDVTLPILDFKLPE